MTERLYAQAGKVVLIIESDSDSTGAFLYTFSLGQPIWDNWLPDIEAAKEQAAHEVSEIPGGVGTWKPIPPEVSDLMDFGRDLLASSTQVRPSGS